VTDAFRLPRHVVPRRYDLTVAPDLVTSTFSGSVQIACDVAERTSSVVCNAKGLDVALGEVRQDGGEIGAALAISADDERVVITCDRALEPGPVTITLSFHGEISSGLLGFYRSTFVDDGGNERVLAATQFEAPHARAAFPCFDEPDFKAVFGITLVVDRDLVALSNGPEIARSEADGKARITFADTIPMSTYLVAWVVGPLEISAPVDAGGVAVRVVHVPGRADLTAFALDVGAFALRYFTDYYGIPYPGEKCDLVALPDFSFGAMENLGLVTFRENRLLLDPAQVTLDERTAAALTIVHEIAHMWFGDLVTMKWWNGIWLNEAFATFMEHLGCDAYEPGWKTWDDFAVGRATALGVDALPSTRTVEYEVHTPEDADGMFDTLTYQKGGSVLRMLERWLGGDAFRAGVRHYLERYQYANTETTDLWDALEDATGQPVRQIMDSWIFQPGFPLLTASNGGGNGNGSSVRLVQQRFTFESTRHSERYSVPVLVRVHAAERVETRSLLLANDATTFDVPGDSLVVVNAGGEGFYRVAYDAEARARLLDAGVLEPLERFAMMDDLWASVLAGAATAGEYLHTARRFGDENDLVVWRALAVHLRTMARLVDGEHASQYRTVLASIAQPSMQRLGWQAEPGDDDRTRQRRGLMVSLLGAVAQDQSTIAHAREVIAQPEGVDPDVAAAAVGVVASAGTADDFDEYVRRFTHGTSPQEQLRYLYALGEFPDEQLVLRAVELALSPTVRPQSAPFVFQAALRNRAHGPAAWAFVRDQWDAIRDRCSGPLVARMLEGVTWLVDAPTFDDVTSFVAAHPVPEAARTIQQQLDRLRVHRRMAERERERFATALAH
jgi:puromycin-sensitive aminopeptidase